MEEASDAAAVDAADDTAKGSESAGVDEAEAGDGTATDGVEHIGKRQRKKHEKYLARRERKKVRKEEEKVARAAAIEAGEPVAPRRKKPRPWHGSGANALAAGADAGDGAAAAPPGSEPAAGEKMGYAQRNLEARREFEARAARGPTIVIDCAWEDVMREKEVRSLSQQVMFCYGANKRAARPARLRLAGMKAGGALDGSLRNISGYPEGWVAFEATATPYGDVAEWTGAAAAVSAAAAAREPGAPAGGGDGADRDAAAAEGAPRLVYLTSDAKEELSEFEADKVYVIGGIVDHNRLKGITHERATAQGVATRRLPLSRYCDMGETTKVLTVNHVFEIILRLLENGGDWAAALVGVLPERKNVTSK